MIAGEMRIRPQQLPARHRRGIEPLARHEPGERIGERLIEIAGVAAEARDRLVVLGLRDVLMLRLTPSLLTWFPTYATSRPMFHGSWTSTPAIH